MTMMLLNPFFHAAGGGGGPSEEWDDEFAYSGAAEEVTVPAGVTEIFITLFGAAGGNGNFTTAAFSGGGAIVEAIFSVSAGDVLKFEVGGGGQGAARNAVGGAGGWPDGGPGGRGDAGCGGGGGSTRFYINGTLKAVAGAGGGAGGWSVTQHAGPGGGYKGGQATVVEGGTGGTQAAGGFDNSDSGNANKTGRSLVSFPGAQRLGGYGSANGDPTTASADDGGGGGGGYYGGGGGGGDAQPGGGGSSWVDASAVAYALIPANRQTPAYTPAGHATVATGVDSGNNGPAVAGGDGYAILTSPATALNYPVVLSETTGQQTSDTTSHTVTLPATVPAGALILILMTVGDSGSAVTWDNATAGTWTSLFDSGAGASNSRTVARYKVADGSEGSAALSITTASSEQSSWWIAVITGATGGIESAVNPSSGLADPPSLTASWGALSNLWIIGNGHTNGTVTMTVESSGYGPKSTSRTNTSTGCALDVQWKHAPIATDNPSHFAHSASVSNYNFTIVVRPD